jgi:hypothetical protein
MDGGLAGDSLRDVREHKAMFFFLHERGGFAFLVRL